MRKPGSWAPPWARSVGTVLWISDARGRVRFFNPHAEALLGLAAGDVVGLPCRRVIAGLDARGAPFCRPSCPVLRLAQRHLELPPVQMRVTGARGEAHWLDILVIPVPAPDGSGPWLVHCALRRDREHRIEAYLERVAARSPQQEGADPAALTRREAEILELLVLDRDFRQIAAALCVSVVTVRNHVQHVLAKLGVHSIAEAVAKHLTLNGGDPHAAAVALPARASQGTMRTERDRLAPEVRTESR